MIRLTIPAITNAELNAVAKVLKSGQLVQGANVAEFERMVAEYLKVKYAVAVSSGTAALHLALMCIDIGKKGEVVVPDFTYPATANVVEHVNAVPVLADIDINTYNVDVTKIEKKITKKTKVIMPVHLFGQPAQMDEILKLARKYNLYVIEDAACALGAESHGRFCGTLGDMGCFSFHPRKVITTGEGGMIVTNDKKIAHKVRMLRNHGSNIVKGKYDFVAAGLNYRMSDMEAGIGIEQMKKLYSILKSRKEMADIYNRLLMDVDWIQLPAKTTGSVYQSYVVRVNGSKKKRDGLIEYLFNKGIESTIGTYSLHCLQYYKKKYCSNGKYYINSKKAFHGCLSLPIFHGLKGSEVKYICKCIKDY